MEDNIQTVVIFLISAVLLFIFPVYVAYEKKDDISYALVLSYTQDFVDSVRNKGYVSSSEYATYMERLAATGNVYDIDMEHKHQSMNPVIKEVNCFNRDPLTNKLNSTPDFIYDKATYDALSDVQKQGLYTIYVKVDIIYDYEINTQIYGTEHISNILNQHVDYYMNTDDIFSVVVKNRNTTLATVMYNLVTIGNIKTATRIYVNYAGQIVDTKWYNNQDNIRYVITDTNISDHILYDDPPVFSTVKSNYIGTSNIGLALLSTLQDNFNIEIKATLYDDASGDTAITKVVDSGTVVTDTAGMNLLLGESTATAGGMFIELGHNGIGVLQYNGTDYNCIASYATDSISADQVIKIAVKGNIVSIFLNDERVAYGSYLGHLQLTTNHEIPSSFEGIITEFKVFKTIE